jgi:hypothetical protein
MKGYTICSCLNWFRLFVGVVVSCLGALHVYAVPITISGKIRYTAPTGNEQNDAANALALFPLRGAKVELWDDNTVFFNVPPDILISTTYTDLNGDYSFTVDDADSLGSLLAGTLDPWLGIYPMTRPALPAPGGVKGAVTFYAAGPLDLSNNDTVGPQYAGAITPVSNIPAGMNYTINVNLGTANNTELSYAAFDAMFEASRYYSTLPASINNSVDTLFPTGEGTSNFSNGRMHILNGDRYDWDVSMHEYGHYVQSLHPGIDNSPGGGHSSANNLRFSRAAGGSDLNMAGTNTLNRRQANELAWGEGWATYYSISGQQEMGSAALGIQRVGDTIYHDNNDTNGTALGLRYGIENQATGTRPSRGEDNEASVARILYDLYDTTNDAADRDRVVLGDDAIWNLIRNNNTDTLDKFWDALISQPGTTNSDRIDYGAIFEGHNVSPQPDETSVALGETFPRFDINQPTFEWMIPQGGQAGVYNNSLLNDFGLLFIDSADAIIWDTGLLGNVTQFTPDPLDWLTFTATTDFIRWVVYGRMTNKIGGVDYITGDFWSDARYFFVVPEPTTTLLLVAAGGWVVTMRRRRDHH